MWITKQWKNMSLLLETIRIIGNKTREIEMEKQLCLNSMEDVKCYHQTLIDMKVQYWKDVKMFAKATQLTSNKMQLTCILYASWATHMEAKLMRIWAKYHDDQKFWSPNLTSWPRIFEMFSKSLPKMEDTKNVD